MKVCFKCKTAKPESEFSRQASAKDGLQPKCKACDKAYADAHKAEKRAYDNNYNEAHRDLKAAQGLEWARANRSASNAIKRRWTRSHPEQVTAYQRIYERNRRATNIQYQIAGNLRSRIRSRVTGRVKTGSAVRDLGCTIPELRAHLEVRFYAHPETGEPMSWDNYGPAGWHIDHRRPLAAFDLTDRDQFLQACHYTNLQPLWAEANLAKGAREAA